MHVSHVLEDHVTIYFLAPSQSPVFSNLKATRPISVTLVKIYRKQNVFFLMKQIIFLKK